MKFILFVQEDPFFLPRHLPKLFATHRPEAVVILSQRLPRDTISKVIQRYLNLFGLRNLFRISIRALGQKSLRSQSVASLAKRSGIPVWHAKNINAPEFIARVQAVKPDLLVSIACPQIMGSKLLKTSQRGAVNLHGGYLPDFPGVFTPFWNLLMGAQQGGCTVHFVDEKVDGGPILARAQFPIEPGDTVFSIYEKISANGIPLLADALNQLQRGAAHPIPNLAKPENYHSFPTREDRRNFEKKGLRVL